MSTVDRFLRCPRCRGALVPAGRTGNGPSGSGAAARSGCACEPCGVSYPEHEGVLDFLPGTVREPGLGQRLMESDVITRIYESGWWRASLPFAVMTGIPLREEMALVERILGLEPADRVLDLACGPGPYARRFAHGAASRAVAALDASWPMLRSGVVRARRTGIPNVRFLHGDAHHLPFGNAALDAVSCCGALHLFRDVERVLEEVGRVTRPGGRVAVAAARAYAGWSGAALNPLLEGLGVRPFGEERLRGLLEDAGFASAIYHVGGVWVVAGGTRRL